MSVREYLYDIKVSFKDLGNSEKVELFTAWIEGHEIESRVEGSNAWISDGHPYWNNEYYYRVKREGEPDSINWDHVSPLYNVMMRCGQDFPYLYEDLSKGGLPVEALAFSSYRQGTRSSENSMVVRPGYKED